MLLSNPVLDGVTVRYDLRKPFKVLSEMNENSEWRAMRESNPRPSASETPKTLANKGFSEQPQIEKTQENAGSCNPMLTEQVARAPDDIMTGRVLAGTEQAESIADYLARTQPPGWHELPIGKTSR